ncbi:MAG: hypothetical protein JJT85_05820 [Chromatiales bacterium]|nr:hypothetical protein [Chromatiales bacterium]
MTGLRSAALALLAAGSLTGCIYSNVTAPLDINVDQTRIGSKTGKASMHVFAWSFAWGDAGVEAAAANGGLEVINHLDTERRFVLFGLYSRITTIAYGD